MSFVQVKQFSNRSVEMSLRVASLDYLGIVAARLRKDAVSSHLDETVIDDILRQVSRAACVSLCFDVCVTCYLHISQVIVAGQMYFVNSLIITYFNSNHLVFVVRFTNCCHLKRFFKFIFRSPLDHFVFHCCH